MDSFCFFLNELNTCSWQLSLQKKRKKKEKNSEIDSRLLPLYHESNYDDESSLINNELVRCILAHWHFGAQTDKNYCRVSMQIS